MKRILNFLNDVDMDERTEHIIDGILDNNAITTSLYDQAKLKDQKDHQTLQIAICLAPRRYPPQTK